MDIKVLNKDNFSLYAMGNYTNPDCINMKEFTEDLAKIKYVKRLLRKYIRTGKLRTILALNHIVILSNVFGHHAASRMLFYKLDKETHSSLKTILLFLNYIDENEKMDLVSLNTVPLDITLCHILKKSINNETQ